MVSSIDSCETGKNSLHTRWFVSLVWNLNVTDRFIDSMPVDARLKAFDAAQLKTAQTRPACSVWVM